VVIESENPEKSTTTRLTEEQNSIVPEVHREVLQEPIMHITINNSKDRVRHKSTTNINIKK
jgi:hypothetical protein